MSTIMFVSWAACGAKWRYARRGTYVWYVFESDELTVVTTCRKHVYTLNISTEQDYCVIYSEWLFG